MFDVAMTLGIQAFSCQCLSWFKGSSISVAIKVEQISRTIQDKQERPFELLVATSLTALAMNLSRAGRVSVNLHRCMHLEPRYVLHRSNNDFDGLQWQGISELITVPIATHHCHQDDCELVDADPFSMAGIVFGDSSGARKKPHHRMALLLLHVYPAWY